MFCWCSVSSLALSTFACVYLPPNKYALLLPMALYKHSHFLYWPMPSFGVSTVSPKKSSSFNMFSTSVIAFIRCLNRHQMRNNARYKGNVNNTSVIIFFCWCSVSSLALSTFVCVYLPPNKYALLLPMALYKHSHFLYWPMPSFGVSTVSPKKSSSFNMFSTSVIAFIRCLNRHQMRNNARYKGNVNNTSVIIF